MSVGFSGKLVLIAITVTAATGGFTLGYFVGKNVSAAPAQPVTQIAVPSPPAIDNRSATGETKPAEFAPPPAEATAKKEEQPSVPVAMQPQEPRKASAAPDEASEPKASAVETGSRGKEGVRAENKTDERNPEEESLFTVQVGAFKSGKEAKTLKARLEAAGFKARNQKVIIKSGAVYKVFVGEFVRKKEAEAFALKLNKTEGLKAFVVKKN